MLATAELALKQLIVSGTNDDYWTSTLNPVDQPTLDAPPIALAAAAGEQLPNLASLRVCLVGSERTPARRGRPHGYGLVRELYPGPACPDP